MLSVPAYPGRFAMAKKENFTPVPRALMLLYLCLSLTVSLWAEGGGDNPRVIRIAQISYYLSDLSRARCYYQEFLGFHETFTARTSKGADAALLTPDQQQKMDGEIESLASGKSGGGGQKKSKDSDAKAEAPFEASSQAILKYSALTADDQKAMAHEVKTAARRNESSQFTANQLAKLDADIRQLSTTKKM